MGVYLSSPITEKESIDEECENFSYGASSMQGWRITQEDAHNCIPLFDNKTKTSLFAVYDGHGGSEVAKYCEKHFPNFIKSILDAKGGSGDNLSELLKTAFLEFDATLTNDDVIKELKQLAGKDDDAEEDDEDFPVGHSETALLKKEAVMPLDELLAQYEGSTPGDEKDPSEDKNVPGCSMNSETVQKGEDDKSSQVVENGAVQTSSLSEALPSSVSSTTSSPTSSPKQDSSTLPNSVDENNSSNTDKCCLQEEEKESKSNNNNVMGKTDSPSTTNPNSQTSQNSSSGSHSSGKALQKSAGRDPSTEDVGSHAGDSAGCGSSSKITEPSASGSSTGSDVRASKVNAAADIAMMDNVEDSSDDDDDDDDEEEEDAWEDTSDDDDDDDNGEEEDNDADKDVPMMDMTNEEPGSDSGCTACVLLMQGKKVIVANAGDSRCILSRCGKAIDLSFDHKPEDDSERERIEKAGGKVTADGRVNGGLNLSRALGDHVYKRNKDLPAREQMITALPDIETSDLTADDQFLVIACDGIWNYMTSQEVVDYVLVKLKDPEKRKKPSIICEELFDHCLAPNTFGDGTGCDNMTCIIVVLNMDGSNDPMRIAGVTSIRNKDSSSDKDSTSADQFSPDSNTNASEQDDLLGAVGRKRCADNIDSNGGKRLKVEEEVV